ncbi:MAG: hypothetical protein JRI97_09915 [Deltaproteobacteria bacterium]|nr:hypothetical protein [Deltaproteobacteria bacterium]
MLTNRYYHAGSNASILRNRAGAKTGPDGAPAACSRFPGRASRPCLGCGCDHEKSNPRDFSTPLSLAEDVLKTAAMAP